MRLIRCPGKMHGIDCYIIGYDGRIRIIPGKDMVVKACHVSCCHGFDRKYRLARSSGKSNRIDCLHLRSIEIFVIFQSERDICLRSRGCESTVIQFCSRLTVLISENVYYVFGLAFKIGDGPAVITVAEAFFQIVSAGKQFFLNRIHIAHIACPIGILNIV